MARTGEEILEALVPSPAFHPCASDELPERDAVSYSDHASIRSENLLAKIVKQVEYYFSDENLRADHYMLSQLKKNKEGYVSISLIASFHKMKKLAKDHILVADALRTSPLLVISVDGSEVKRVNPFDFSKIECMKPCAVLIENLPEDRSVENIRHIFMAAGIIKNIHIRDPHATSGAELHKIDQNLSAKLHAIVEYETAEAAEKAVAVLANENWRSGMRVRLLKQTGKKYTLVPQCKKASVKGSRISTADNMVCRHDKTEDQKPVGEKMHQIPKWKRKAHNNWNRYEHDPFMSGHAFEGLTAPASLPKMPDGTRGFTMGRGKSL